ncbi:MAG: hypothetical protein KJ607_09350, partial [Bacteroidetes bacterium]|nr:hypothetical protein [Bacteroidota bacterium]
MAKYFRQKLLFNRSLKDRVSTVWMFVCTALIFLLPLLIGLGLYLKSGGLLSSVPLYEVLFSGEWQPWEGKFG